MKKIVFGILVTAMTVAAGTASAFAAEVNSWGGRCFVDSNRDGVCDNYGVCGMGFVDTNGDGVCDHYGARGMGFVDANGDGVCDNYGVRGMGFVDGNGDGVCDHPYSMYEFGFGMGKHCGRNR